MTKLHSAAQLALERGLQYLCAAQDEYGRWTDFYLPVGTSDAWVTAFAGLSLVNLYPEHARRAAAWLISSPKAGGGWGYNGSVAADADSTAFGILLLARLNMAVPDAALQFLWRHYRAGQGFCTYAFDDPAHQWTSPCADVTATSLAALHAAGRLSRSQLHDYFNQLLAPRQRPDGSWTGYWWVESAYPTALVLEVWTAAGGPALAHRPTTVSETTCFETASRLLIATHLEDAAPVADLASNLVQRQHADGAWAGDAQLRVEPSHPHRNPFQRTLVTADQRRIFTTAQVTRALARALPLLTPASTCNISIPNAVPSIPALPIGELSPPALSLFRCLTRSTFDGRTSWPAPQLSSLSGGLPIEFSASTFGSNSPELRYTVDAGDVQAPPHRRAISAVATAREAVDHLGYQDAWSRLEPAIGQLLEVTRGAEPATRFLVWIGVDHTGSEDPILKLYFRLFRSSPLSEIVRVAGFPISKTSGRIFDLLHEAGFAQELGFGIGPEGRSGVKIYWELPGWRRTLVDRILQTASFPATADALCPEIPLLLRESLAAKSRAGISLRLHPQSGDIAEVTTSAEFIQHMLPAGVTADRVDSWIVSNGWNPSHHRRLFNALAQQGDPAHTLFTRTVARNGDARATIYLRPSEIIFTAGRKRRDTNNEDLAQQSINQINERTYS